MKKGSKRAKKGLRKVQKYHEIVKNLSNEAAENNPMCTWNDFTTLFVFFIYCKELNNLTHCALPLPKKDKTENKPTRAWNFFIDIILIL